MSGYDQQFDDVAIGKDWLFVSCCACAHSPRSPSCNWYVQRPIMEIHYGHDNVSVWPCNMGCTECVWESSVAPSTNYFFTAYAQRCLIGHEYPTTTEPLPSWTLAKSTPRCPWTMSPWFSQSRLLQSAVSAIFFYALRTYFALGF